jgi:outer membrane protein assembly factor BamB
VGLRHLRSRNGLCGLVVGVLIVGLVAGAGGSSALAHGATPRSMTPGVANWSSFHFNAARTGKNGGETTLTQSNVPLLQQRWSTQLGPLQGGSADWVASSPAVVNGTVFIGAPDGNFTAVDESTGTIKWVVATGSSISASPAVAGGIVYIPSNDGVLHALRTASGATVWNRAMVSGAVSSPAVVAGVVYQASGTNLYALNAKTGALLWSAQAPDAGPFTTPAVSNGLVIIESGVYVCCAFSLHVEALNASSGALVWSYATYGSDGETAGLGPLVSGGIVYTGTGSTSDLIAFDEASGTVLWDVPSRDLVTGIPTIANGVLYVEEQSTLAWFNAATGQNISFIETGTTGSAVFANHVLYSTGGGLVEARKPGGYETLWTAAPGGYGPLQSSPAVVGGMVFVGSNANSVVAYSLP